MQIIHLVLGKANPDRMNGVNKVAYQLALNQHELGASASVWGIANDLEHNYPPRPFPTRLFLQLRNKLVLDPTLRQAIDELPNHTVIHVHGAFIPEFFHVCRALYRRGIPWVYTPHGALTRAALQQSRWRKAVYFNLFERFIIRRAAAVQLLGEQEYTYIDQLLAVPHKVLIPNGMDLGEVPDLPPRPSNPVPVFTFCGRLDSYHKGLDLLLQAFERLIGSGRRARLELIGDGPDRPALERFVAARQLGDHVVFHGARYGQEKYLLMAQGDVFVHTSRMEGFPMAVLEAAALGLPCLTSAPTNINSFIEQYDAGFPFGEPAVDAVLEELGRACDAFELRTTRAKGENARRMVAEVFDWKRICTELIELYQACLLRRGSEASRSLRPRMADA